MLLALCLMASMAACGSAGDKNAKSKADPYVFTYNGVEIAMGASAGPVVEALGEPTSFEEYPSCAGEGTDKTYGYGSFYMTTYAENGDDKIANLWFADDTVATADGIRIGSLLEQVKRAYPDAYGSPGCSGEEMEFYPVQGENAAISIVLQNGRVTDIRYMTFQDQPICCPVC